VPEVLVLPYEGEEVTLETAMQGPLKDWTWGDWFFAQEMLVAEIKRLQARAS